MKLSISMLERRKTILHILFCSFYLVLSLVLNWRLDGLSMVKVTAILIIGAAGLGVAYTVRYILILAFRERRPTYALVLLVASFLLLGIAGYFIFHGFENRVSEAIVNPAVEQVLKKYIFFFMGWYLNFAKYGVIFYLLEKYLFNRLDKLLSRHWPEYIVPSGPAWSDLRNEAASPRLNQLAPHFFNNLMHRVYNCLGSNKAMEPMQVAHLSNLVQYGAANHFSHVQKLVPLDREISVVRNLLAVEGGHRIRLRTSGDIRRAAIPPTLLVSIAKNMLKHGAALPATDEAILDVRVEGSSLYISSENGLREMPRWQLQDSGHGLQHMRQLLEEVYGQRATLHTAILDGCFYLYLRIDNLKNNDHEE